MIETLNVAAPTAKLLITPVSKVVHQHIIAALDASLKGRNKW